MDLITTERFLRDYWSLPATVRSQADRKLRYLAGDITHPSLRVRRVQRYNDIYEGSVNMSYRFLFQITAEGYLMLRIGRHHILDRA